MTQGVQTRRDGVSATVTVVAVVALVSVVAAAVAYTHYVAPDSKTTLTSSSSTATPSPLITYSADAYATEAAALLAGFSQSTKVAVAPVKSGGTFADASQIESGAPDDIFISVSLAATGPQYLGSVSSDWAIGFASDQMVIAYNNATSASQAVREGRAAESSNATTDWNTFFTSLTSGVVKLGISDPVADPAGLRGWLVLEAAGYLYSGGNQSVYTSELLKTGSNVTGASAAALVAPLQSDQIQFLFIYKSAAVSDHLNFIALDGHINLGDSSLGTFYSKFSYTDSAGTTTGSPIILCVTVPVSSTNPSDAILFVKYVVQNAAGLSPYGLTPFSPARLYNDTAPPAAISALVSEGLIVPSGGLV
jgi:molybdate/tungstate transport system substrate-binding protein